MLRECSLEQRRSPLQFRTSRFRRSTSAVKMSKNTNWEAILKWSLSQTDGTGPTRKISDEERKWFSEAVMGTQLDVVQRMKEISTVLQLPEKALIDSGVTVKELEGLLEELQEHVESIDMANDLHAIGGLKPLLSLISSPHPNLRSRAAEVITTVVQNNPKGQKNVLEVGGLHSLLTNVSSDNNKTAKAKSLGAISSLVRNNPIGLDAFRLGGGLKLLKDSLMDKENPRLIRKALNLLQYVLEENSPDISSVLEFGALPALLENCKHKDLDIRLSSFQVILTVANAGEKELRKVLESRDSGDLKTLLEERMESFRRSEEQSFENCLEERLMVERIVRICYPELSFAEEKSKSNRISEKENVKSKSNAPPPLLLALGSR